MTVFANGLEISSKKQGCKVIAAFPDPCFTPPLTPATPPGVPVPYPNFGMDSDLASGTGTVNIGGDPVSQENSSKYSKCSGDEAGSAPKKGVVTSKNMGSVYAQKWSMDVKFEGKGVVRFSDMTTSNHACNPGQPPGVVVGTPSVPPPTTSDDCIVGKYSMRVDECRAKAPEGSHEFHHIIPDRTYRCGKTKAGLTPGGNVRHRNRRQSFAPSHGDGISICLPKENHVGSAASPQGTAVHQNFDNTMTEIGRRNPTAASPSGTAPMTKVRGQALLALKKLVPKTISAECFELAMKEVIKQTEPIKHKHVRTEFSIKNLSSRAKGFLARQ